MKIYVVQELTDSQRPPEMIFSNKEYAVKYAKNKEVVIGLGTYYAVYEYETNSDIANNYAQIY